MTTPDESLVTAAADALVNAGDVTVPTPEEAGCPPRGRLLLERIDGATGQ